ncbi:MAG: RluA family pseudouridine synthase [Ruminococcus sp.]|nr:RluA family pseudouridine synthase [Ruminococcus sp.]
MKEFIIGENDSGQRLERFVLKVAPHLPKGLLFKFLRTKKIKCNGKRCEASQLLEAGDQLRLFLPNSFFESKTEKDQYDFLCAPNQIQVLYEDTNILIVDKPVGLVVHTDDNHTKDTLIHRIQHYLYQEKAYIPEQEHAFAPALCNRLDRNTSGIVIAAKTALGLREMNQMIREDRVQKVYLCVAVGKFQKQSDTLYGYHKKIERTQKVVIQKEPASGFRKIITKYTVLAHQKELNLVRVQLLTGRTHQIRAHLASIGTPILGDNKYGNVVVNRKYHCYHQLLCAYQVQFSCDVTSPLVNLNQLKITCKVPDFVNQYFSNQKVEY